MSSHLLCGLLGLALLLPSATVADSRRAAVSTVNMPPGWAWPPTEAMRASGTRCLLALRKSGLPYRVVTRRVGKIATPVVIPGMRFSALSVRQVSASRRPPVMDCHMALALVEHAPVLTSLGVKALAKMTIDASAPDASVDVAQLLRDAREDTRRHRARPRARRARRRLHN